MKAIIRGFRNLTRFEGRDSQGEFWPYAGLVLVAAFLAVGVAASMAMEAILADATDGDAVADQIPDLGLFFAALAVPLVITVALLAAAVTRRLHDRGLPGFVGLPTPALLFLGIFGMQRLMTGFEAGAKPDMVLFMVLMANNMLYVVSLGILITLLALRGNPEANRYGPPPA